MAETDFMSIAGLGKTPEEKETMGQMLKEVREKLEKEGKGLKKTKIQRGAVYVGHLPHGFFEEELKKFFSQFGRISKVRLCRSSRTGKSKGYAFIQFREEEVAKIAAESMNNYLMFERVLKAEYIPPEKVHRDTFLPSISIEKNCYLNKKRKDLQTQMAKKMSPEARKKFRQRTLQKVNKTISILKNMGIEYKPVIYDPVALPLPGAIEATPALKKAAAVAVTPAKPAKRQRSVTNITQSLKKVKPSEPSVETEPKIKLSKKQKARKSL